MRTLSLSLLALLAALTLAGCDGSNREVASGFPSGATTGPTINLTAAAETVPFGGSTVISAAVHDASGAPVSAALLGAQAVFSSLHGGKFSSPPVAASGLVTVTYTAPTADAMKGDLPVNEEITVMYGGALARVTILLHRVY